MRRHRGWWASRRAQPAPHRGQGGPHPRHPSGAAGDRGQRRRNRLCSTSWRLPWCRSDSDSFGRTGAARFPGRWCRAPAAVGTASPSPLRPMNALKPEEIYRTFSHKADYVL